MRPHVQLRAENTPPRVVLYLYLAVARAGRTHLLVGRVVVGELAALLACFLLTKDI